MSRFDLAIAAFDELNARDPISIRVGGVDRPRELVEAERRAAWVDKLEPTASEALRLAARSQHLCRWEIPRSAYAEGRIGYLEWRKALSRMHADRATEVLQGVGYDDATVERVRTINHKRGIKADAEVQTIEDALCLAFLEFEIDEFSTKHSEDKLVDILKKTWGKMSERGHARALELPLSEAVLALVRRALAT